MSRYSIFSFRNKYTKITEQSKLPSDYKLVNIQRGITEIRHILGMTQKHGAYICGGYARYVATERLPHFAPSDVDVYFQDQGGFDTMLAEIGDKYMYESKESAVAITLKHLTPKNDDHTSITPAIQLIKPIDNEVYKTKGDPYKVMEVFDINVCKYCIISPNKVIAHREALTGESLNNIVFGDITNPYIAMQRAIKYIHKGYSLDYTELQKIFALWSEEEDGKLIKEYFNRGSDSTGKIIREDSYMQNINGAIIPPQPVPNMPPTVSEDSRAWSQPVGESNVGMTMPTSEGASEPIFGDE